MTDTITEFDNYFIQLAEEDMKNGSMQEEVELIDNNVYFGSINKTDWLNNREINIADIVEKVNGADYVQWAKFEALVIETIGIMPYYEYRYEFLDNCDVTVKKEQKNGRTCMVWCKVQNIELSKKYNKMIYFPESFLAVANIYSKQVILNPTFKDIENTLQRCLVKVISRFYGLAHYLYEGVGYEPLDSDDVLDHYEDSKEPTLTDAEIQKLDKEYEVYKQLFGDPEEAKNKFLEFLKSKNIPKTKANIKQVDLPIIIKWLKDNQV